VVFKVGAEVAVSDLTHVLERLVEDEPLRLLWAMTLGWRTAFTGDISELFLRSGTQHMFAIDGLRIALLSGMIVALLGVLSRHLQFPEEAWTAALKHNLAEKLHEANLIAFYLGRKA